MTHWPPPSKLEIEEALARIGPRNMQPFADRSWVTGRGQVLDVETIGDSHLEAIFGWLRDQLMADMTSMAFHLWRNPEFGSLRLGLALLSAEPEDFLAARWPAFRNLQAEWRRRAALPASPPPFFLPTPREGKWLGDELTLPEPAVQSILFDEREFIHRATRVVLPVNWLVAIAGVDPAKLVQGTLFDPRSPQPGVREIDVNADPFIGSWQGAPATISAEGSINVGEEPVADDIPAFVRLLIG